MEQVCNTTATNANSLNENSLSLKLKVVSSHLMEATVEVSKALVDAIKKQTVLLFKRFATPSGLIEVPLSYIEQNYKLEISRHIKQLVYNYCVIEFLLEELENKKIYVVNSPRPQKIEFSPEENLVYVFDISTANNLEIREWKNFVFKAPKRKNYKDLDKQVELFIKKTQEVSKKHPIDTVQEKDWVCFSAQLLDNDHNATVNDQGQLFWIQIVPQSVRNPFLELFLLKNVNHEFITNNFSLIYDADYEDKVLHKFLIKLVAITKGSWMSIEGFKSVFKLNSKDILHEKLIEVFSYRNDQSQRRAIIEEMFHLLLSKHRFEIPKHLVLRKQEEILAALKKRPDYEAYRSQQDFARQVSVLSEKQLKEEILIDQIAHNEKIKIDIRDIQNYLGLISNSRLKEFIYFRNWFDSEDDHSHPLQHGILKQICKREKTLNHILFHLTR